jgi:hypothetical protein
MGKLYVEMTEEEYGKYNAYKTCKGDVVNVLKSCETELVEGLKTEDIILEFEVKPEQMEFLIDCFITNFKIKYEGQ